MTQTTGPGSRSTGTRQSAGDIDTEHAIYAADAILDYPQSGERFRGRSKIQAQRGGHPAERHFTVLRIPGGGDLWVSECVITYDGVPTYSVSIMEFADDLVTHETQYFADPFHALPGEPRWLSRYLAATHGTGTAGFGDPQPLMSAASASTGRNARPRAGSEPASAHAPASA